MITHEPTFYNHQDQTAALAQDPTYEAKQRFIKDNRLVVWRFHDHAHALRPDPLVAGRPVPSAGPRLRQPASPASTTFRRPRSAPWRQTLHGDLKDAPFASPVTRQ